MLSVGIVCKLCVLEKIFLIIFLYCVLLGVNKILICDLWVGLVWYVFFVKEKNVYGNKFMDDNICEIKWIRIKWIL